MSSAAAVVAPARRTRAPRGSARPRPVPAAPPRRRHLRVVVLARRARLVPSTIVLAAVATALVLFALVVVHVLLAQSQLSIDRLQTRVDAAETRYEQARLAHAQLAAPSRIVARAGQLGLVPPAQPAVPVPVPNPPRATTPTSTPPATAAP